MNPIEPHTEHVHWQELYQPTESRWQDLIRILVFGLPIAALIFIATSYAYWIVAMHFEGWMPSSINQYSYYVIPLQILIVILLPITAMLIGLNFIFKHLQ